MKQKYLLIREKKNKSIIVWMWLINSVLLFGCLNMGLYMLIFRGTNFGITGSLFLSGALTGLFSKVIKLGGVI